MNDTRDALQQALRDTYGGERTYVWVRDFDESTVWFEVETEGDAGMFGQPYMQSNAGAVVLTGDRTEVRVVTTYVPVNTDPAGRSTTTQESEEDTMPQIEEARLRQLEEAAGRAQTLEAERDAERQRADTAERALAEANARDTARTTAHRLVVEANATLPAATVDRIVAEATRIIPLTDAGALDETALRAAVEAARTAEEAYLATLTGTTGGGVHGFGASTQVGESTRARNSNPWGRPLTETATRKEA